MKISILLILLATLVAARDNQSADSVKAAEKSWAAATVAGDSAALDKLLAGDLSYTHSTGETDTKTSFIDSLKSGKRAYSKIDPESMDVRMYGNTAVLSAVARVDVGPKGGAANNLHLRYIHVWIFEGGRWQLVAHQSLKLAN